MVFTTTGITTYEDIVPDTDSTLDLGTNSVRYANIYCDTIYRTAEADVPFANGWKIRELGCPDSAVKWAEVNGDIRKIAQYDKGLQIMSKSGEVVGVWTDEGLFVKDGKVGNLDEVRHLLAA